MMTDSLRQGVTMARLSISAAAKAAGIARQTLYAGYINTGKITVGTDEQGHKYIDTAEILRVFGTLQPDKVDTVTLPENRHNPTLELDMLKREIDLLRERLAEKDDLLRQAQNREEMLNRHIERLTPPRQITDEPTRTLWSMLVNRFAGGKV